MLIVHIVICLSKDEYDIIKKRFTTASILLDLSCIYNKRYDSFVPNLQKNK